eukprot:scaffold9538_cov50-Phaeocystis_antarctica.AAC.3
MEISGAAQSSVAGGHSSSSELPELALLVRVVDCGLGLGLGLGLGTSGPRCGLWRDPNLRRRNGDGRYEKVEATEHNHDATKEEQQLPPLKRLKLLEE